MKKALCAIFSFLFILICSSCANNTNIGLEQSNTTLPNEEKSIEENVPQTAEQQYKQPIIPEGFEHLEGDVDSGYVIVHKNSGNEFVWVPVDGKKVKLERDWSFNESGNGEIPPDWYEVGEYDGELKQSVEKYGGFYIARYEAGVGDEERTESNYYKYNSTYQKVYSISNSYVYNWVEYDEALRASDAMASDNGFGNDVISTLISPAAWDTTLNWISLTDKEFIYNSYGKGYYTNKSNSMPQKTGQYNVNNIYDMAGNVSEWSTEKEGSLPILRGGDCRFDGYSKSGSGAVHTRSPKGFYKQGTIAQRGFRVMMIVK